MQESGIGAASLQLACCAVCMCNAAHASELPSALCLSLCLGQQVLPGLLESLFRPPMSGPGLQLYINAYNSIWLFVFVCVAYAVVRLLHVPRR